MSSETGGETKVLRKILMGVVWFVAFYIGAAVVVGGVAGGIAGARNPHNASEAGRIAGQNAVARNIPFIFGGSLIAAVAGSALGVLPGTRSQKFARRENGQEDPQ